MNVRLRGVHEFAANLRHFNSRRVLEGIVRDAADDLKREFVKHVPEDTGELASEIVSRPKEVSENRVVYEVGVPDDSPAIDKARATEYGAWNYSVGSPEAPKTSWPAKSKSGARMPWLRYSVIINRRRLLMQMKRKYAAVLARQEMKRRAVYRHAPAGRSYRLVRSVSVLARAVL